MRDQVFPFTRYWPERCSDLNSALLYDTPDRLLTLLQLSPQTMIQGYQQLLESSLPLRPFWQLELEQPPEIEPLSGALIYVMCGEFPDLLNAYQAVDAKSGGNGDAQYLERLNRAIQPVCLLQAFLNVGELRKELDDQLRLVQLQRQQLDNYLNLQQQSQKFLDEMIKRSKLS